MIEIGKFYQQKIYTYGIEDEILLSESVRTILEGYEKKNRGSGGWISNKMEPLPTDEIGIFCLDYRQNQIGEGGAT